MQADNIMRPFAISFPEQRCAHALRVITRDDLAFAFKLLGVRISCPAVVLVGGAKGLEAHHEAMIQNLLHAVAQIAESLQAAILDGGTQSGLIALMGKAYAASALRFPLIGVAVERMVRWPGHDNAQARANLEPHHTHFILTPGSAWGDESQWLAACARELAHTRPSLTLLLNGGEISRRDVNLSLQAQRPVLVVAGTGRLADELAESDSSPLVHALDAANVEVFASTMLALLTRS